MCKVNPKCSEASLVDGGGAKIIQNRKKEETAEDGVRGASRLTPNASKLNLTPSKARTAMGLVADDVKREGDSPSLPPSTSPLHAYSPDSYADERKHELVEISMKTMALLRRNQQLQKRLTALQQETRAFVRSALKEGTPAPCSDLPTTPQSIRSSVE
ncbi:hypothetical protein GE061_012237 [Apolygus lucorum]|uniref:Uncharacterized protein n=1 Tax=Apolygus lucorum TaxID=248454 RepID=A0A8S9XRN7_APOLU|nr:hypothetical protein GE061_012237 [Apolygus lucorum]